MKNTICWADIAVKDLNRAMKFYSAVLHKEIMNMGDFALLPHENDNVSGCLSTESTPSDHGTLVYFDVTDFFDQAVALVSQHGGKILSAKEEMGEYGTRAIVLDSEGNRIALYKAPATHG